MLMLECKLPRAHYKIQNSSEFICYFAKYLLRSFSDVFRNLTISTKRLTALNHKKPKIQQSDIQEFKRTTNKIRPS